MINNQDSKVAKLLTMKKIFIQLPKESLVTPALLKQKKSARLQQVLKNTTVSDVEKHADCLMI